MTAFEQHNIDMSPGASVVKTPGENGKFFTLSAGNKSSVFAAPFMYGTPVQKSYKRWPYVIVSLCAAVVLFGYIYHELPDYRMHLRYSMYEWFGAEVQGTAWVGGHREVVDFVMVYVFVGLPTMIGGIFLAYGDALPPVTIGWHRTFMRFLKRKIMLAGMNISYGESMFTLLFLGLNAIWFAAIFSRKYDDLVEVGAADGDATFLTVGYVFGFNAVLSFSLLILPATRNCFWMIAMGIDYAHAIKFHRWMGAFAILMVVCHAFPYYRSWIQAGTFISSSFPCFDCDIGDDGRKRFQNFTGQLALFCCVIIGLTSIPWVRRNHYEVFYYAHHLFIVVLICVCLHFSSFVIWMYPGVCLYMMHRIMSKSQNHVPCEVVDLEAIPGEITRLVFRRSPGRAGHYHAGQFVYLHVPLLSRTQWHPFSISSSPIEYEDTFTVHVKSIGNFTKSLFALAIQAREERKMPLIYVDGFYGQMTDAFQQYPVLVFVAGGIGATPIISILGKVLDSMRNNDPNMVNAQVYFHWTSREIGIFHEFEPLLDAIEQFDPDHEKIKVRLCFTGDQHLGGVDIPNGITLKPMDDMSMVPTRPFFQASRSVPRQMMMFFVTFTASFFSLYFIRLGYPILGTDRVDQNLWPLQRFMEVLIMVVGAAAGWFVAVSESKPRSMSRVDKARLAPGHGNSPIGNGNDDDRGSNYSHTLSFDGQEVQFKHPVSRTRLNVKELFADVVKEQSHNFAIGTTGIGTWVSGPMGMIHAVESEAKTYAGIFDVHYEEFEM
uniref:FAD-binding FR-type domain-containing protein n=1 Tax=Globisporangium ultimum (strain ATCC 200006 / CBS 805.95 / DAOM BR144) TaxID=431595 RepID=K3W6U6_GLOUD